jgi:death-on-curing protein
VIEIHQDQIDRWRGLAGVPDPVLLSSAVAMARAGVGETYLHADLFEMAAAHLFHITQNHSFLDGNKRTGTAAALVFLEMNGLPIDASDDEIVEAVPSVTSGELKNSGVAEFLRNHASS